ncbi:MAG: aspartate carbamoyltransferase [Candidatus Micrarchaeota archaeon]
MEFKGRDFLSIDDISNEEIMHIMETADRMTEELKEQKRLELCKGKVLATLFFEPSTRTQFSFQSAMLRLGGTTLGFSGPEGTSVKKGETLEDTVRTVEGYCDVIAMRHPEPYSAMRAADVVGVPVINGGDGPHEHPTQTMLDLFTIYKEHGRNFKGLNIAFYGDLKYGRTTHSLCKAVSRFGANTFFVAPETLEMPADCIKTARDAGARVVETHDLMDVIGEADVVYTTRIQKERFPTMEAFEKASRSYRKVDKLMMYSFKKDALLMHPLPRVDEISVEVDDDPRSVFMKQAHYGVPVRMAIIALLLGAV